MEYYVTKPADYWIAQNAINITLNALGDKNRIQCSVVSGAVIMCFLEDVKPASQGGDPENGDGLYYGVNHEPKRWPLSISPTYFNTDSHKYVYVAIPRSEAVGTQAVIVFPSEELDIYGRARRLLTSNETGEPLLNEDGEQQVSYEQIGSTDYFYIYLNGIISAPAVNAGTGREERGWERIITDWGKLETAQGREERQNSNEWFSYSQVNQVVTFLKEIAMNTGSSFRNLILNHKNLTDVATSETAYTDSDTMVATPGYVEKHYLSKSHDDSTPYSLTVGGILRAVTGYITSLYSNLVQSTNYTGDGIADTGYRLTADHNGHSKLTIDEIYVRMKAVFESLEVRERTYTGGDQIWSCAGNRIVRVDYLGNAETADHVPQMVNVHADGRPEGTGEGDVYSVPVPGDTYGYSDVKVPWLLRQMPLLARARVFARYRKVRIVLNEPAGSSANRAAASESTLANIRRARCYFLAKDDDMEVHNWWRINDLARCQTMNLANTTRKTYLSGEDQKAGNIFWWRKVIGVSYEPVTIDDGKQYHYFDVSFDYLLEQEHPEEMATSVMEGSDIPAAQDSVVQFGNTIIEGRMNLMMMEVNGGDAVGYSPTADAPCLKAYRGIYCFDLNKSWVGGQCCKMKLSPKSGYEFYGPNFKIITEYDVVPVPIDRGLWLDIVPTRDDYREHEMVRKCYYYDKVSHNGSYWLCSIVDGAHWVDGNGDYISDAAYSALTEAQKALCSRKQNYTIEEPSADSIDWTEVVKRGEKGDNMIRLDISNEMDMIPTTSALRIDVARTVETTVRLFDGATEVDISAATLSPTGGPASSIATFSQAADGKGKKLSWAFKTGQTMAEAYEITVSYTYKSVVYTAVFTVSASKGEAVWQLKPSLSAIPFQRNSDNTLTPASRAVGLSLVKIDGGSTATYTSVQTGLTVRYSTSSMPSSASAGTGWSSGNITVANTADNLYIALFNASGVLLDRETIPVIKDGEKGQNGKSIETISVYKAQSEKPDKPTGTAVPPSGWSKVPVSGKESASLTFTYTGAWSKSGNVLTSNGIDNNGITKVKVSFSTTEPVTVKVKLTASSEANYDYVLIGNPDEDSVTRTGNYKARVSGTDSIEVELEFGSVGEHFFVVAYAKDVSGASGSDNGKFEILGAYKSNAIPIWVSTSKLVNDVCDGNWSEPVRWNGKDGETGKNGKDAAIAVFSRNPIVFQGSSLGSSVNTNSISSVIRVLDGGTEYVPTNINVDSKPSGVTVTASSGQVSVSPSQTGLSEDMLTGSIKLTITYNGGKTVVGYLTTTVARAGEDASYDFITLHGTCHDGSSAANGFITVQKDGTKTSKDTLGRGLTFFAVNRETLQIVTSGTLSPGLYDTYGDIAEGSSGACNSLAAKIRSCNNSYFVCLVSQDAVGWNENLVSAIREYGGMTPERTTVGRYPFAFIGVKGLSQGYALQQQGEYQSAVGAQVTAYVNDSMFSSVKQGHMGRNFYYDGVYDSSKSYKVTQYEAPFVSYNSNYWVRIGGDGTTATGQAPSATSPYWALMTSTFKYLITEAIFSEYAKLGSWIFNGDYMFSSKDANGNTRGSQSYTGMSDKKKTSGFIPTVAMDAANGRSSFSGDKVRFNPDGSGWLADGYISWNSSGNAEFSGEITATGGSIAGYLDVTGGLNVKNSGGSTIVQVNGGTDSKDATDTKTIVDAGGFYVKRGSEGFRLTTDGFQRYNPSANQWVNFYGGRYAKIVSLYSDQTIRATKDDDLIIVKAYSNTNTFLYLPNSGISDGKVISIINAGTAAFEVHGNGNPILAKNNQQLTMARLNTQDRFELVYVGGYWYANYMSYLEY